MSVWHIGLKSKRIPDPSTCGREEAKKITIIHQPLCADDLSHRSVCNESTAVSGSSWWRGGHPSKLGHRARQTATNWKRKLLNVGSARLCSGGLQPAELFTDRYRTFMR